MRACVFASAISLALAACAPAAPPTARGGGLPRVASLNLCTDELILLLAAPGQVASTTHLSHDPQEAPWWRAARRYPANDGTMLGAARDAPTLVVTMGGLGADRTRIAARLGVRLVDLPYPQDLPGLAANLRLLGTAIGRSREAAHIAARVEATQPSPALRTAMFLSSRGEQQGTDPLGRAWLARAGLLAPPENAGSPAEALLTRPPELLLLSSYRAGQYSRGAGPLVTRAAARTKLRQVTTDGRHWTCMGPSLLGEVARLRRVL